MSTFSKRLVGCFLASLLAGVAAAPVAAAVAYGSWGSYGPQAGYAYRSRSGVNGQNLPRNYATLTVEVTSGGNAPPGYIGAQARMYKSNGALCADTGMQYNANAASGYTVPTLGSPCIGQTIYSKGRSQAWTGSSYNSYSSFQSPNQNG